MSYVVSDCFTQDMVGSPNLHAFKNKLNILMGEKNPLTLIKCKDPTLGSEGSELQLAGGWQSIPGSTVVSMPSSYTDQERSSWLLSERRQWQG